MTGKDVKALVREALFADPDDMTLDAKDMRAANTALAPCVVLTAEEAEQMRGAWGMVRRSRSRKIEGVGVVDFTPTADQALALLTPDEAEASDD